MRLALAAIAALFAAPAWAQSNEKSATVTVFFTVIEYCREIESDVKGGKMSCPPRKAEKPEGEKQAKRVVYRYRRDGNTITFLLEDEGSMVEDSE
jgi:hypothetical protein